MPSGFRFPSLEAWLEWQQGFHPKAIDPGLDRIARVLSRTRWRRPAVPVITVGGTNGKGSCVAIAESILRAGGYRVGSFTSPHLVDYRERIRLDGRIVSEMSLTVAFERIADALGPDSLSYFEFNALAALLILESFSPDLMILEVGMGGRLDAVNVIDADVSVVTSIGLDHQNWLGEDIESIGREKAGIFRPRRPAVFGSTVVPDSIVSEARRIGSQLQIRGSDFDAVVRPDGTWDFIGRKDHLAALPLPGFGGRVQVDNAAAALAALFELSERLPLEQSAIVNGLRAATLSGRFQRVEDLLGRQWILDVAHNPDAALVLAENLASDPVQGRTIGICGFLADKDAVATVRAVAHCFDEMIAVTTEGPRGLPAVALAEGGAGAGIEMSAGGSVGQAMRAARERFTAGDRVVVFGSFHVVGPALQWLQA
jgi:dihydrofolate synthase/folylpolyglutamate synthase